ncbi:thioredoxin family protein [Candidatus Borrarchaeum sp.]|uniref:thioredoxin family protein n=1 Tax=Candidatus Borrarchaeum sp. TaxID=2846742 RepID=UPI00257DCB25|nr:thioredoxin family protein [Candidatus Borrarchaeum sp.]
MDLDQIRERTQSAYDFVSSLELFKYVYDNYQLNQEVITELKKYVNDYTVVLFAASWCRDSRAGVPVFALLETEIGLEVRVFGGMETAPFDQDHTWTIPPSPPEAEEWGVTAIPWIVVFLRDNSKNGQEVGKIVERPQWGMTMEEELLEIIKNAQAG